jgi:amidophosphoribosyltransferase
MSKLHEECGVFGIYSEPGTKIDAAKAVYYGLYALQHRGQESAGIAVNDDGTIVCHKNMGLVPDAFDAATLDRLKNCQVGIGHVRYSTTGDSHLGNAQPFVIKHSKGTLSIAHNGNIMNSAELRSEMEKTGSVFQSTNDTEVIAHLIAKERISSSSIEEAIKKVIPKLQGSYSLVIMSPSKLIAVRDPKGFRPLSMGKIGDDTVMFASETCAFDAVDGEFVRDIEPGEIVVVSQKNGIYSIKDYCREASQVCIFEYIYFARPDSVIDGVSVYQARKMAGRILAKEAPAEADIVIGVPDSGLSAAIGYSEESGIPYGTGLIKNRYIGRTFIQPSQEERTNSVKIKLNALADAVAGKRVVMVDDSIVRGTTCTRIISLLKSAGAKEVHVRVSSPPFLYPCFFGTDVPDKTSLVAWHNSVDEMCRSFGADSIAFLSIDGLKGLVLDKKGGFCSGCFSGGYPIFVPPERIDSVPEKDVHNVLTID